MVIFAIGGIYAYRRSETGAMLQMECHLHRGAPRVFATMLTDGGERERQSAETALEQLENVLQERQ